MSTNLEIELDNGFGGKVSITCSSVENNNHVLNNTASATTTTTRPSRPSDDNCVVQRGTISNISCTTSSDNNSLTHPSNLDKLPVVEHGTSNCALRMTSSNVLVTPPGDVTRPGTSRAPAHLLIPMLVDEKLYYVQSPIVEKTISQIKCPKVLANVAPSSDETDTNSLETGQQSSVEGNICDSTIVKKSSGVNPLNDNVSANAQSVEECTEIVEVIEKEEQTLDKMSGNESTNEIKTDSYCAKHNEDLSTLPAVTKTEDKAKISASGLKKKRKIKNPKKRHSKEPIVNETGLEKKKKGEKIMEDLSIEEEIYECACYRVFVDIAKYKKHKLKCKKVDSDFELSESEPSDSESGFCAVCDKTFDDPEDLKKHELVCHPVNRANAKKKREHELVCHPVNRANAKKKREHELVCHPVKTKPDSGSAFCAVCDQTFDDPDDLKKHVLVCHVNPATVESNEGGEHVEPDDKKVERTITIGWINSKGKVIQDQGIILRKPTTCGECGHYFRGRTAYAIHKLNHENVKAGVSFECPNCRERFSVEADLQVHENVAHCANHIPFKCHHCDERFPTRVANDSHMLYTHDEDGGRFPFRCHECSAVFTKREVFVKHMAAYTNEKLAKNITCKECKKKFALQKDLTEHMWKSHEKHPCQTCGKLFTKPRLHIHMRTHAEVKAFECPVCKKRFAQGTNRAKHMRVHTGTKPYKCDVCEKTFNHKVSLKMHQKKMHNIDWWADNGVDKSKETSKGKAI